jgi:hypothetical protein
MVPRGGLSRRRRTPSRSRRASDRSANGRRRACSRNWCRPSFKSFTASRPWMSILPSVDASMIPTPVRVATHSRATAACRSSPGFGKYHGRFHWPTFSKSAPCSSCHAWSAVVRWDRSVRRDRAGDRAHRHRRVVGTKRRRAGIRDALAERVREDRDAVDVAELPLLRAEPHRRCSAWCARSSDSPRAPASTMSDAATSFCRSTNCFGPRSMPFGRRHDP